jgi:hypothetical protein
MSAHSYFRNFYEIALFVQREKHRLPDKHHEFIDDMASRAVYGREPTLKQHHYLHGLFYKLGGKITMKPHIIKGYGYCGEDGYDFHGYEYRLWIVVEGDETMFGFIAKSQAEALCRALLSHSLADAERLRRVALVHLENNKYMTPAIFSEP